MFFKLNTAILTLFFACILGANGLAQQPNNISEWTRIQSDDGNFSIEIPSGFNYFFDRKGASERDADLKDFHLLNAYFDGTLISVELYEESQETLDRFIADDSSKTLVKEVKKTLSKIKKDDISIRQIIQETQDSYMIRQYFRSNKYVYILTAASRKGETLAMRRFLDSLLIKEKAKNFPSSSVRSLSSLLVTPVNMNTESKNIKPASSDDEFKYGEKSTGRSFLLLSKPRPGYTDSARQKNVQGKILFRIEFSANGFIPKIEVIGGLPEGLLRKAIFAALRMKFLPEENNGKPVSTEKVIGYSFTIY